MKILDALVSKDTRNSKGSVYLHLFAQSSDISGCLNNALATVVMLIQLVAESLEHRGVRIHNRRFLGCFGPSYFFIFPFLSLLNPDILICF